MPNSNPPAAHADDPQRRKRRLRLFVAGASVLLFIVVLVVTTLDSVGHRWVQCEVVAANGQQGDQNSASAWVVVIDTQDCGRLLYVEGVNRDNVHQRALDFQPGQYEMKMGLSSQLASEGIIPGLNPSFEEYRRLADG